jgi:2-iminobutanoate/2-iminopropanoate deaminase
MPEKKVIASGEAPKAIGPYSQAIRSGDLLFLSGQTPLDPKTGEVTGDDITSQTRRVIENLRAVLSSAGLSLDDVVKTMVFLKNMDHFAEMNKAYGEYFAKAPPARSTVEVSRLPRNALVEIEAIAAIK